jgi:murein DD-endopeptidase MepM/ murein hydrolase activator NlpD/outer membrane protein assembly factor BamB
MVGRCCFTSGVTWHNPANHERLSRIAAAFVQLSLDARLLCDTIIMISWRRFIIGFLVISLIVLPVPLTSAQSEIAPCGYVDGFDLPVPDIDLSRTDFAIYRARFGGLHTGIDVAFEQLGSPVRAAARGRVTYSDPEGWDTEKGVVVIQHTMPDGTLVNTLYGHMEELNGYTFPAMNQCVKRGDIIGAVGFPSRGRPHLHYEVRTRYRHEGGPGYTEINPLELGWLHPLDFTFLARVWIHPACRRHFSLPEAPTLPLRPMPDGTYVVADSAYLKGITADGQSIWQFDTLGAVTGLLALPDGRLLAATSLSQVLVLNSGSYSALWQSSKTFTVPPVLFGETVVFAADDNSLMAFTPDGVPLWETAPMADHIIRWAVSGDRLAAASQSGELWVLDQTGSVIYREMFSDPPLPFAAPDGAFFLMSGSGVLRLDRALSVAPAFDTGRPFTTEAELIHDPSGTIYLYTGEGRALYAYGSDGALLWIAYMPGSHLRAPRLGMGGGRLIYALSTDGQLLAYDARDGHLVAQLALYDGGISGSASARWLAVQPDDTVTFSGGYLSVVTLEGLALFGE